MAVQFPPVGSRTHRAPRFEGRVDEDAVYAFVRATNDVPERYERYDVVPPLFTATLILEAQWHSAQEGTGRDAVEGARGSVHGEHDVFYWGRVLPDMELRWDASTYAAHQTRGGVLVAQRILLSDTRGTPLVEHLWSTFHSGGTIEQEVGPPLPDHGFPEEARSHRIGSGILSVDRDQAFRYAGVSGDHAGHALTDDTAREEGHPGKILQGMCTFGLMSGSIVDMVAGGDPGRLRRLAVRFSAPTFPGRDVVVDVYDAGSTEEGGRAFAFEGVQDDVVVIKHGRAELVP